MQIMGEDKMRLQRKSGLKYGRHLEKQGMSTMLYNTARNLGIATPSSC